MKKSLLIGLLLFSIGLLPHVVHARTLAINRAYTGGGNPHFTPIEYDRRTVTVDDELQVTGTTDVAIQEQLNEAKILGLENPSTTIVVTLEPNQFYDIQSPLVIHGNTVLEGNGAVLEVSPSLASSISRLITIRGNGSGIHSCDIRADSRITRAAVVIAAGATNVVVFDNRIRGDEETAGPQLIEVESSVANLEIDGNHLMYTTDGLFLAREEILNTAIRHNRFSNWRDRAIFVKNRSYQTPVSTINICGNLIEQPHQNGVVRQPIAFQSDTVGASPVRDVRIQHNTIMGNGQPYIVGRLDDFSQQDNIVPIGTTGRYRLLNGATADMISLQDVLEFDVFANQLEAGGEAGINIARGSGLGMVRWNSIKDQDTVGINIGSNLGSNSPNDDPLRVFEIDVFRNSMINPGRNKAEPNSVCEGDESEWARSGIAVQFADDVTLRHNYIEETEAALNTVCFGIHSLGSTTNLVINAPTFDFVAEGVIWSPKNSSVDIFPLDFERLIGDANLDGIVDELDVCTLDNNWNQPGTWAEGDFDEDGFVDEDDFGLLVLNLYQEADYRPAPGRVIEDACGSSQQLISSEGFESGWGIWNDGGSDCRRNSSEDWAVSGSSSIRIRDGSSSSKMTTDKLDLSDFADISLDFAYIPRGMDVGEAFSLEISNDGGATYQTIGNWELGTNFQNESIHTATISATGPFSTETRFRFRCEASSNSDRVYIDNVTISGN